MEPADDTNYLELSADAGRLLLVVQVEQGLCSTIV